MSPVELIQNLTRSQLDEMVEDFNRLLVRRRKLSAEGKPTSSILPARKYQPVFHALGHAQAATNRGEKSQAHFMNGVAAAFYGIVRLAEAGELKATLAPRLGLSVPASEEHESAGDPARKESPMLEAKARFTFDDLVEFFTADDVKFRSDEDKGIILAGFGDKKHAPVYLMARVDQERQTMHLSFRLPFTAPEEKRGDIAEAVTRANYGLTIGGFEMDMRDGELNYKVSVPIDEAMLSHSQLRHCMVASLSTINRYMPAYFQIIFNGVPAEDAIEACER